MAMRDAFWAMEEMMIVEVQCPYCKHKSRARGESRSGYEAWMSSAYYTCHNCGSHVTIAQAYDTLAATHAQEKRAKADAKSMETRC